MKFRITDICLEDMSALVQFKFGPARLVENWVPGDLNQTVVSEKNKENQRLD